MIITTSKMCLCLRSGESGFGSKRGSTNMQPTVKVPPVGSKSNQRFGAALKTNDTIDKSVYIRVI